MQMEDTNLEHNTNQELAGAKPETASVSEDAETCIEVKDLNLYYSESARALNNINLSIPAKQVTAFIGPSGCGKSSLLRCFNRMNDLVDGCVIEGEVLLNCLLYTSPSPRDS